MRKVLLFLASCCLVIPALAQVKSEVSVRTLQLGSGEMPEAWVNVSGEKEPVKVTWLGSQPTRPLNVIHNGSLDLLHYPNRSEENAKPELLRTVALPADSGEVLLLGMADGKAGKYVAIKDSFIDAKFNDWMAINTSGQTVAFIAGEDPKPVVLKAGASTIFHPKTEERTGVKFIAKAERKGEIITFYSTYLPAFSGQRTLIIFYHDGKRMRAKRIGDRFIQVETNE